MSFEETLANAKKRVGKKGKAKGGKPTFARKGAKPLPFQKGAPKEEFPPKGKAKKRLPFQK